MYTEWAKGEELFFARVKGESMVPTLWDGDYLLIRRQAAVENDAFPTPTVNLKQQTVQILGKAVGVYRKLNETAAR